MIIPLTARKITTVGFFKKSLEVIKENSSLSAEAGALKSQITYTVLVFGLSQVSLNFDL